MRRYSISIVAALTLALCASAQTGVPPYGSFTPHRFDLLNNVRIPDDADQRSGMIPITIPF